MYDVTSRASLADVDEWERMASEVSLGKKAIILVGNKSGLEEDRTVSFREGQALARKLGALFLNKCQAGQQLRTSTGDNPCPGTPKVS